MATYSASQLDVLKWISWPTAFLSVLGSSSIIYHIVKSRSYYSRNRLLMGVCFFDIVLSLSVSVGGVVAAQFPDSRAICQTQGFSVQLGSAVSYYTGALNLYLMLLVRNNVSEPRMAATYEPWFHAVCILYPLITAIACIPLGLYNSIVQGCFIHAYPFGCDQTDAYECVRGEHARDYFLFFSGGPHLLILIMIVISQTQLYRSVRTRLRANERYDMMTGGSPSEAQKLKLQSVATQSLSYVMAYVVTLVPTSVIGYIQYFDYDHFVPARFFPLLCILFVAYPGQGALNFLVFIRPQYLMLRRKESYGRWRAFWEAATVVDMQQGGLSRQQRRSRSDRRSRSSMMMIKATTATTTTTTTDQQRRSSIKTITDRDLSPTMMVATTRPPPIPDETSIVVDEPTTTNE
jgi:hypothetical protein